MILKFDHIAFTCSKDEIDEILGSLKGYNQVFYNTDIPNLEIKHKLMSYWCDTHDILLLEREGEYPIEITAYEQTGFEKEKYEIRDNIIIVNTSSLSESIDFYRAIGFKQSDDCELTINPVIGNNNIILHLNKLDSIMNHLDNRGFCCLAFITNSVDNEKRKLDKKNISTTDIKTLRVNSKELNIFFAYNTEGDICEFISINKEEK